MDVFKEQITLYSFHNTFGRLVKFLTQVSTPLWNICRKSHCLTWLTFKDWTNPEAEKETELNE